MAEVGRRGRRMGIIVAVGVLALATAVPAGAVHFYRGPGGDCTPAEGELGDAAPEGGADATVHVLHNTFNDASSGLPVTRVAAGQTVEWVWTSAHCHSVDGAGFTSGFHYPTPAPESPQVVPGFFDYPVPDDTPALVFRETFDTPGTYQYSCVHHAAIGMVGTVVVE